LPIEQVAWYAVGALHDAAAGMDWPDNSWGNACRLLAEDIVEHAATLVAAAANGHWSSASSLLRLMTERVELFMAASIDGRFGRRYLDSIGETVPGGLKPKKRARAQDSWESVAKAIGADRSQLDSLRESLISAKDIQSDYYVHPTPLGPMTSRLVRTGEIDVAWHWDEVLRLLAWASAMIIAAATPASLSVPDTLIRAMAQLVGAMSPKRPEVRAVFEQIWSIVAGKVSEMESRSESSDGQS